MHCDWVPNTWCEVDREFVESDSDDPWPFFWRMAYQQFDDLESKQGLFRSIVIYRQLALMPAAHHNYPIYDRFMRIARVELDCFWLLGLALVAWFSGHPGRFVNPKELVQWSAIFGITEESIQRFLNLISCTRSEFVKALSHPKTGKTGFELYNVNPLLRWPLIRIGDG